MFIYSATPVRVVDGDTVDMRVDLGFDISHVIRVRVLGVNTPERGQEGYREAAAFVEDWFDLHESPVTLATVKDKTEKYGRYLGIISAPRAKTKTREEAGAPESLSDALLHAGLAKPYNGGSRG